MPATSPSAAHESGVPQAEIGPIARAWVPATSGGTPSDAWRAGLLELLEAGRTVESGELLVVIE